MNEQEITVTNLTDHAGNPTGGSVTGTGLLIQWQKGPLGRGEARKEPNGTFVETVLQAAKQRLEFYQGSEFACDDNAEAIMHIDQALQALRNRTTGRERRQVEGTHQV